MEEENESIHSGDEMGYGRGDTQQVEEDNNLVTLRHVERFEQPMCSTTRISKTICEQLNMIISLLLHKDEQHFKLHKYKRCFIVRKPKEVFQMIKDRQEIFKRLVPTTFDFTTLYTKLPHDHILTNMRKAIVEAIEYKNRMYARLGNGYGRLRSVQVLMEWIEHLVTNTYIANNPKEVYHQKIGIPMGTNCAPEIANLVLYVWEAEYMDELVRGGKLKEAQKHIYTKRYIDDIICFSVDPIPMTKYQNLEYSQQTCEDGSVTYLGAKFFHKDGKFHIEVFDKTTEWKFKVLKYPAASSNVPNHQMRGIFMGEAKRFQMIANSLGAFKKAITSLTRNLYIRGHPIPTIRNAWREYIIRYGHKHFRERKRRFLVEWFPRMLKWACRENPKQKQPTPQKRSVVVPQDFDAEVLQPNRIEFDDEGMIIPLLLQQQLQVAANNNIEGAEGVERGMIQELHEDARSEGGEENIVGPPQQQLLVVPLLKRDWQPGQHHHWERISNFLQRDDVAWTEDYAIEYEEELLERLPDKNKRLIDMRNRIHRQQPEYAQWLKDVKLSKRNRNTIPLALIPNVKWFCDQCWQRFFRKCEHTRDQCIEAQNIREIALQISQGL